MILTFTEKLKVVMGRRGMSFTDLAKSMETTRQNLSNKIGKDNFSEHEMKRIADLLGCDYESPILTMRDTGEKI